MICQECSENMATILFTQIVNGKKTVLHLCKECAHKKGIPGPGAAPADPVNGFLAGMAGQDDAGGDDLPDLACTVCGQAYREFRASGRLGCPDCYEAFSEPLQRLLRKIHGNTSHRGKAPVRHERPAAAADDGIPALRRELRTAVEDEDYERAAELRDRIRALERQDGDNDTAGGDHDD